MSFFAISTLKVSKHLRCRSARSNPCKSPVCKLGQRHHQITTSATAMRHGDRTRAYIKVAKGCGPHCDCGCFGSLISTRAASGDAITIGNGRLEGTAAEQSEEWMMRNVCRRLTIGVQQFGVWLQAALRQLQKLVGERVLWPRCKMRLQPLQLLLVSLRSFPFFFLPRYGGGSVPVGSKIGGDARL